MRTPPVKGGNHCQCRYQRAPARRAVPIAILAHNPLATARKEVAVFVCDMCLEKHYDNDPSLGRSFGACELCDEVQMCNDIHHSVLIPKKQDDLGLEGEVSANH